MNNTNNLTPWYKQAADAMAKHVYLKGIGTTLFIIVFFQAYFYLLKHVAYPITVMPITFLDRLIAFNPAALPLYLSLWLYVSLPPALLAAKRELFLYAASISLVCLVALTIFYFWPTAVPRSQIDWSNYPAVAVLKNMDLSGNACPSLHVATAVFSAAWLTALLRRFRAPPSIRIVNVMWCIGIVYSTMALRQHVAVDVAAGLALGGMGAYLSFQVLRLDDNLGIRRMPHAPLQTSTLERIAEVRNEHDDSPQVPHEPLTAYYETEQQRSAYLQQIFDVTAADYDRIEAILALGTGSRYRRDALIRSGLKPGMNILDVGVGTGLLAAQAGDLVGNPELVTGIDPSSGMLAASKLPSATLLVQGRAESLPFPDNHFDFLSMGYALRHISDLGAAFSEFERVLKPGGRLCILELTRPESTLGQWLLKGYMRHIIPVLTRLLTRRHDTATIWRYYWDSIEACIPPKQVLEILSTTNLTEVRRHLELGLFSEYQATKSAPFS